jgi:ribosome-associated translation inhibitor RaiA
MGTTPDISSLVEVDVTTHGRLPGVDRYARDKIGALVRRTHQQVLHAHVRVSEHADPAVVCPVVAQANLDVNGRLVRAQAQGMTARAAIDVLEMRLRRQLERLAQHTDTGRSRVPVSGLHEWRHGAEPTLRPRFFPRPLDQRRIIRRKSFTLWPCSVDEAALEMELLDYDFHLFNEEGTKQASVLYRSGPTGYRLAQVKPTSRDELASFDLPLTVSSQPAPRLTFKRAAERLGFLGQPFLFFIEVAEGRAFVLYRRYDGHYGLISPAG